jgi:signal transduction histidine kinase
VAATAALGTLAMAAARMGPLAMGPLAVFQCSGLVASGVVVLRGARRQPGTWLYGGALTLLGVHVLDAPLVMRFPELVPWGFVLAASLEVVAGLGMVVLHYEEARERLLRVERALEQARRIEALGRVAGGVAHDFNNVLTILQAQTELMRHKGMSSETVAEAAREIEEVIGRGTRLVRQLLAFGRRAEPSLGSLDAREVVRSTLDLLEKVVPKCIQLELRCEDGDYTARLDRALLEQVVLNLVTNARDAIDGSGTIRVDLQRRDSPAALIVLRVVDSGAGIPPEHLERVFEPFFTTKDGERGTGLGLASVEGAVNQLGGTIHVESRLGEGTVFEVVLPCGGT